MFMNSGKNENLFRGAFLQSGTLLPVGDITQGQYGYDWVVSATGCSAAQDTLQCLREAPYEQLQNAVNAAPHILSYQVNFYLSGFPLHITYLGFAPSLDAKG